MVNAPVTTNTPTIQLLYMFSIFSDYSSSCIAFQSKSDNNVYSMLTVCCNHQLITSFSQCTLASTATSLSKASLQFKTRKHRQSYRHADPRRQRPQVAQWCIGVRNTDHGH